jgi:hypothetical protein
MTSSPWDGTNPSQPQDSPTVMTPTAMTPTATSPTAEPGEAGQPGRALRPNYGLIGYALLLVAGSGAVIWQLVGLPRIELSRVGPGALVVGGLGLVLIGQLGLLRRRRIERRAAATRSITPPTSQ